MPIRSALPAVLALTLASAAAPALAAGSVAVSFVQPERYADIGFGNAERQRNLEVLEKHFVSLGRRLPDGQVLKIDVLEVDLAGTVQPWRRNPDVRVLKGQADWPRMTLRWSLAADGRPLRAGEDRLADMTYLSHHLGPLEGEPLAHDRHMVDRWFGQRVLTPTP